VLAYRRGGARNTQLAWFDRAGKQLQTVGAGPTGDYHDLALSPDGTRVAVSRGDLPSGNIDLWLIEIERNISSRFTFHAARDWLPVWSPDGARIALSSDRDGFENLYQKLSSGAGSEDLLLKVGLRVFANDWSPDGSSIVYSSPDPKTKLDLWVLPLAGDRKPVPYLRTEFTEMQGQFAPDGKFLAYTSDESGRLEIYVQPFPGAPSGPGAKWMVSSGGGFQPRWSRNGKEIFYLGLDAKLMALEVKTTPRFEASVPQPLFQTRIPAIPSSIGYRYAPSADGRRFLMSSVPEETASAPITLVLNFAAGPKR
jgi:Tol biopolymer transport system component